MLAEKGAIPGRGTVDAGKLRDPENTVVFSMPTFWAKTGEQEKESFGPTERSTDNVTDPLVFWKYVLRRKLTLRRRAATTGISDVS
jgi:hypothetical protein